jgi:hypothetical protein
MLYEERKIIFLSVCSLAHTNSLTQSNLIVQSFFDSPKSLVNFANSLFCEKAVLNYSKIFQMIKSAKSQPICRWRISDPAHSRCEQYPHQSAGWKPSNINK